MGNIEHKEDIQDQQTLTERTGAFKDRVMRELRRHTWDQINQSDMREKLGHRTRGAKTQQNSPGAWQYLSCSRPQPCQSEVPDMQQLSREIIIEHDLLLHINTK